MLVSGRKRPITAVDDTPEASSVSGDSATTVSSVPPRFRRSRNLGRKDDRGRAERASGDRPAIPATEGGRGGGFAPAHRLNLDAARSNNQALSEVIAAALQRHTNSTHAAGSRPSMPTHERESWGGSAPAQSNNLDPALGNDYHELLGDAPGAEEEAPDTPQGVGHRCLSITNHT